jgi:hypothetical protein
MSMSLAKRFWIPLVLVFAHALLVALVATEIALSSDDPEAGMIWIALVLIDVPILWWCPLPLIFTSDALLPWTILVAGTIQWSIVGLALQQVVKWLRNVHRPKKPEPAP